MNFQDIELPKAVVAKIAKAAIPEQASLQKDVRLALSKSATVFVSCLAATANDIAKKKKLKTITGDCILEALDVLEMSEYKHRVKEEAAAQKKSKLKKSGEGNVAGEAVAEGKRKADDGEQDQSMTRDEAEEEEEEEAEEEEEEDSQILIE